MAALRAAIAVALLASCRGWQLDSSWMRMRNPFYSPSTSGVRHPSLLYDGDTDRFLLAYCEQRGNSSAVVAVTSADLIEFSPPVISIDGRDQG